MITNRTITLITELAIIVAVAVCACGRHPNSIESATKKYNTITDTLLDDSTGAMVLHYVNFLGQDIKMESYIGDTIEDSWILFGALHNSYNHLGLVDSQIYFYPDLKDMQLRPLELDIWNYDSTGNVSESRHCIASSNYTAWSNVSRYTYKFSNGMLMEEKQYEWQYEDSTWQKVHESFLGYDAQGNHIHTLHYDISPSDSTIIKKRLEKFTIE